jgi:hypothetical protein
LKKLKGQGTGIVARNSADDAQALRIDGVLEVVFERCLSRRCERKLETGQIFAYVSNGFVFARGKPISGKIRMAFNAGRRALGQIGFVALELRKGKLRVGLQSAGFGWRSQRLSWGLRPQSAAREQRRKNEHCSDSRNDGIEENIH